MLSLDIFTSQHRLGSTSSNKSSIHSSSPPRNAYDFMKKRQHDGGDPSIQSRYALIRMASYGSDTAPLCVRSLDLFLDKPPLITDQKLGIGSWRSSRLYLSHSHSNRFGAHWHKQPGHSSDRNIGIVPLLPEDPPAAQIHSRFRSLGIKLWLSTLMLFRTYRLISVWRSRVP